MDELGILDKSIFLEEPVGRDTAPAIALACMKLDPQEIVFVTPSDHVINVDDEYRSILVQAKKLAKKVLLLHLVLHQLLLILDLDISSQLVILM